MIKYRFYLMMIIIYLNMINNYSIYYQKKIFQNKKLMKNKKYKNKLNYYNNNQMN